MPRRCAAITRGSTALLDDADELPLGSGRDCRHELRRSTCAWLAARLGFSRIVANSIDATGDRDFVASFLYASSLTMVHLSRLAEDMILFTSEEFGSSSWPTRRRPAAA